eukprot:Colp12_sorted_trinity150504_noHs@21126
MPSAALLLFERLTLRRRLVTSESSRVVSTTASSTVSGTPSSCVRHIAFLISRNVHALSNTPKAKPTRLMIPAVVSTLLYEAKVSDRYVHSYVFHGVYRQNQSSYKLAQCEVENSTKLEPALKWSFCYRNQKKYKCNDAGRECHRRCKRTGPLISIYDSRICKKKTLSSDVIAPSGGCN